MEIDVLHTSLGDKRKQFDTSTEKGRIAAQKAIEGMLRKGTAIFLETEEGTFRVVRYDPKRDALDVIEHYTEETPADGRKHRTRVAQKKTGKMTAVAPRAGG